LILGPSNEVDVMIKDCLSKKATRKSYKFPENLQIFPFRGRFFPVFRWFGRLGRRFSREIPLFSAPWEHFRFLLEKRLEPSMADRKPGLVPFPSPYHLA